MTEKSFFRYFFLVCGLTALLICAVSCVGPDQTVKKDDKEGSDKEGKSRGIERKEESSRPSGEISVRNSQRIALVIGNSEYRNGRLSNPANDADDMNITLKKCGFEVIHKKNALKREMKESVSEFGKKLRSSLGVGLFYFAGHGLQVNSRNYLIPVDATIEKETDVEFESLDVDQVLAEMSYAGNAVNIIILDACRDNFFVRSFRSFTRGLATMHSPKDTIIAYATSPGSVANDGKDRNGLYTGYLLKYMTEPGLSIEQVFKKVRSAVAEETHDKQIPWDSVSLTKEFYFIHPPEKLPEHSGKTSDSPEKTESPGKSDEPSGESARSEEYESLERVISDNSNKYQSLIEQEKQGTNVSDDIVRILKDLIANFEKMEYHYRQSFPKDETTQQKLNRLKRTREIKEKDLYMRTH